MLAEPASKVRLVLLVASPLASHTIIFIEYDRIALISWTDPTIPSSERLKWLPRLLHLHLIGLIDQDHLLRTAAGRKTSA